MSSMKKAQGISKAKKAKIKASNQQMLENTVKVALSSTEPQPRVPEDGITLKGKKRKSGAEEVLDGIKKRQTSGKKTARQMELTTKLVAFEEVQDAIEAETAAGAAYLCMIPSPADWVANPGPQPHWSTLEGQLGVDDEALSVSSEEYQALAETEQSAKPSKLTDRMKNMCVEADGAVLRAWYAAALGARLRAAGAGLREARGAPPGVLRVSRACPRERLADAAQMVRLSGGRVRCLRCLYVCEARRALGAGGAGTARSPASRALTRLVAAARRAVRGQMTLVLVDAHNEYKKGKLKDDLDMAVTDLLVSLEVDTAVVSGAEELASLVLHFTKALAEEPHKLAKRALDSEAEFYMRGDNNHCVTVDRQGNGLSGLWQQMLGVLPHSSLEAARAVAGWQRGPRLLAQALRAEGGAARLAARGVARSAAPGARARRLGPELAHRLRALMDTTDGDVII